MKPKLEQKAKREDTDGLLEVSAIEDGDREFLKQYVKRNGIPKVIENLEDAEFKDFQLRLERFCGLLVRPDRSCTTHRGFNVKYRPFESGQSIGIEVVKDRLESLGIFVPSQINVSVQPRSSTRRLSENPTPNENSGDTQKIGDKGEKLVFLNLFERFSNIFRENVVLKNFNVNGDEIELLKDCKLPVFDIWNGKEFLLECCLIMDKETLKRQSKNFDLRLQILNIVKIKDLLQTIDGWGNLFENWNSSLDTIPVYLEVKSSLGKKEKVEITQAQDRFSRDKLFVVCIVEDVNEMQPKIQFQKR